MGNSRKMRVAVAAVLVAAASARNFGPVNIDGVGQKYLLAPDWSAGNIQMNGDSGFTLNGGGRVYLGNSPNDGWDPNNYWQTPLNEMHFSYTLDLSNVGCHCNAAGYFIGMPGPGGGEGGDYYCDANFVGGQWCPEYDTLESNKHTIAGTLNTNRPFTVSHYQNSQQANIWMSQDGREASFDFCSDGGYCSKMAQSYGGMVFSASLWGGGGIDMGWLDGMTGCWGECNIGGSSVTFSNFALW